MKKITRALLFLHPENDFGSYMLFDGLYRLLGKENLDIFPYINHYMGQGRFDDWYQLDDSKQGYTSSPGFVTEHDIYNRSFDEIVNNVNSNKYDIIFFNNRTYSKRSLDHLIQSIGTHVPPLVLFEAEDYFSLDTIRKLKRIYNTTVNLKREYIQSEIDKHNDIHPIYPMPFSSVVDIEKYPDKLDKYIDLFVAFGNTHPLRKEIIDKINSSGLPKKYNIKFGIGDWDPRTEPNNIPQGLFTYSDYLEFMSRSKINIVARGWGFDTLRRFEAPCFSGLVISDNIPISTPNNFLDKEHVVYYKNDLSDLLQKIEYYLSDPQGIEDRIRIGTEGRKHCLTYHTTDARARGILNRIEGHLN